ncbi:MAG: hypothetical protein ABI787_03150 [Spartobacteria bacterium]
MTERTEELATALAAKTEFLLESDELTTGQAESVEQILTSGRHLLTLIDRNLAVSISDPGALEFLETSALAERPAAVTPAWFTRS